MTNDKKQMTTTILFIRHGQTDWNVAHRWQGHADVPLNEMGRQQAHALATRLVDWPIEAIYSSDLKRCRETAVSLANVTQLTPTFDSIWRERDVGAFSGLTREQIEAKFPELWANRGRGLIDPPEGETAVALRKRTKKAFEQTIANHNGEMIAVVTHGGVLYFLLSQLLGMGEGNEYGRFTMRGNTGLSIVEVTNNQPLITLLNDTSHLATRVGTI